MLIPDDGDAVTDGTFGASLAVRANRIAVGDPANQRVVVFEQGSGVGDWSQLFADITPSATALGFGTSVAFGSDADEVLVIGRNLG